jgi:hypothetical protein
MRRRGYSNLMLTMIAALLAINLVDRATSTEGSIAGVATQAHAQQNQPGGELVSAAQQRKMMIAEIRSLSERVDRLDKTVRAGINVKVTEMPRVRLEESGQRN